MTKTDIIKIENLEKCFTVGDQSVKILKGINVTIKSGEFVIIFGPSGCGKSTMLHTLLGLEKPTSGKVFMDGNDFYEMTDDQRSIFRKHKVGIIYQQPIWIKALSVLNNVSFPLRLLGKSQEEAELRGIESLKMVGMDGWGKYLPSELSAGQQQKVSLARALIINPIFIAADEPTGNLDTISGNNLMEMFKKLNEEGKTIVMITHDLGYLRYATTLFHAIDGQIVEEMRRDQKEAFKSDLVDKKSHNGSYEANVRDPEFLKHSFTFDK